MKTKLDNMETWRRCLLWIFPLLILTACDLPEETPENKASETPFELSNLSKNQHFIVTVSTEAQNRPPIGRFHNWLVTITDAQSRPVSPLIFSIGGGMPSHGHGLPTQPQITENLGKGLYRLEGVKFNMSGTWVIKFRIVTQQWEDTVEFEFNVSH